MSAFKRYQSKVFWEQMASRDLNNTHFTTKSDTPRYNLERFHEKDKEENSVSKLENETVDGGDITAMRVCKSNENTKLATCEISLMRNETVAHNRSKMEETDKEEECGIILRNKSGSPLSQDIRSLKSQDSGFSDSERSDCSEAYENVTPRRKSRRKKTRQRRIQLGIGLWLEGDSAPTPTHTSTPKSCKIFAAQDSCEKFTKPLLQGKRTDEERAETSKVLSFVLLQDESLGDFLYASEPPEDAMQSVITKSMISNTSSSTISAERDILNSRNDRQLLSTRAWLTDLTMQTESECGITLQSKNLPRRRAMVVSGEIHVRDLKMLSSAATAAASKLLVNAEQFEQHYRSIVDKITRLESGRSEMELLRSIEEMAFSVLSLLGAPPPRRIQQGSLRSILTQLQNMKTYVDDMIDTRLDFYVEKIVRGLEEVPQNDNSVARGALAALTALGLSDPRAGNSIARCSGIKALLTYIISAGRPLNDFVAISLRALASICCSATTIEYFAKDGGPEILTDLLVAETSSEREKMEATALVVQITAPWTNALGLPHLQHFANSLIPALNQLVESTSCAQTLLLAAAALNHLSKSRFCAIIILEEGSVKKLLKSVKKSTGGNVWLMEQVAALIGELARFPEGRSHLAKARASVALVSFLRMRPPGLEDAYRRLEITATATLTRLCVEPEIARQVVAVGGSDCLPSCRVNDIQTETDVQVETSLFKYTRSLRRACKKAARQIGIAKAKDNSALE